MIDIHPLVDSMIELYTNKFIPHLSAAFILYLVHWDKKAEDQFVNAKPAVDNDANVQCVRRLVCVTLDNSVVRYTRLSQCGAV